MNDLETRRKKLCQKYLLGYIGSIIIAILAFFIFSNIVFSPFILVFGIVITSLLLANDYANYKTDFKKEYVLKSLQNIFTDLKYDPNHGLDRFIIADTNMMDMGDIYHSNDYIEGKYKNINFKQSDVHIEEEVQETDASGNTVTEEYTLFLGRWMIFDFNKPFKANIEVCQKGFANARVNRWGDVGIYHKIVLEDEAFNKKFKVYAQNEHEAFYILTPALMGKIMAVTEKTAGSIIFCFVDNKLHIGINNYKDSFEPSIWHKIDEEKILNSISKDIDIITRFVDELSLDNDLFKKEN